MNGPKINFSWTLSMGNVLTILPLLGLLWTATQSYFTMTATAKNALDKAQELSVQQDRTNTRVEIILKELVELRVKVGTIEGKLGTVGGEVGDVKRALRDNPPTLRE